MTEELIRNHIKTHSKPSVEDDRAVNTLNYYLQSEGRINTNFSKRDTWPNHDGTFEFVSNPNTSRIPEQVFSVQIKGSSNYQERNGNVIYNLKSLAFPAFIEKEVTSDPGILFVVFNPQDGEPPRVFWKYLSPSVIKGIDFSKNSTTISFTHHEEIKNTKESINNFCNKLQKIVDTHLFLKKLDKMKLSQADARRIIQVQCEDISNYISEINTSSLRDVVSRKMMNKLYDICYSVLVLNALYIYNLEYVTEKLAWDLARLDINKKYLSDFMVGLKYVGIKIPEDGQSERLMLKYYDYLWEIRKLLRSFDINVLENLEHFPLHTDTLDKEYYERVANSIEKLNSVPIKTDTIYYVYKKNTFYVNGERYYEVTLQMASLYATKFNRITVYTKLNIATSYSIKIRYATAQIDLWGIQSTIKVIKDWSVSINPKCLNQIGKIINCHSSIKSTHGEYDSLMKFLTSTGMNLLELIDFDDNMFNKIIEKIYEETNTEKFKEILVFLHNNYSNKSNSNWKYTIRYILLSLREDILRDVISDQYNNKYSDDNLNISSKCYPFEKNPYISNLVGKRTNRGLTNIYKTTSDIEGIKTVRPYWLIESLVNKTGEIYIEETSISSVPEIEKYNSNLDNWEKTNGFMIKRKENYVYIESYEKNLISILKRLLKLSKMSNEGQESLNSDYIKKYEVQFQDKNKKIAIEKAFILSRIMLIYGAAGTGKTTLMNYISNMFSQEKKLFLTKTYAALNNLKRRIDSPGQEGAFECIDSFIKQANPVEYSLIFVDECSTIDNRTMNQLLKKIDDNTLLIMAGDIYQIESIDFGNWFYYAKEIINRDGANIELLSTWRTEDQGLKNLWNDVRKKDVKITERLAMDGPYSENIGKDILSYNENEIVLCLNYDGKFGLNNINCYFQNVNQNEKLFTWAEWTFKKGDPILFLDTKRSKLLYNNLKGKIIDISKRDTEITFTLDIDTILTEIQCLNESFKFLGVIDNKTRIELKVLSFQNNQITEDNQIMTIIPFQIAYAVSIHKAQGLEYDSVKVIIPSSNTEKITHSIFYTAITRAKKNLKIYWSPETMQEIIKSISDTNRADNQLSLIRDSLELE